MLGREGGDAYHFSSVAVHQERSSRYWSHAFTLGGTLVRNDLSVLLAEEGAERSLDGLYVLRRRQHADHHTAIDHSRPHCNY